MNTNVKKSGGKRAGAGRKQIYDRPKSTKSFTLSQDAIKYLETRSNASEYVDKLIRSDMLL